MIRTVCLVLLAIVFIAETSLSGKIDFEHALPGRTLVFPRDHGKHPEYQTEWWYFTGNLTSDDHLWGFQLTFFRRSMLKKRVKRRSAWAVRDVYPAHFALTDITGKRYHHAELISREGPGLAQAASNGLNVRVKDWCAYQQGDDILIKASENGYALDLRLRPLKPVVLHGDRGYSRKGDADRQASYYYSFTRLEATGSLTFNGICHKVIGTAWMDHEFGSSLLLENQVGWDWFSLQLDDGTEIMTFQLRKRDGSHERPFGTFVPLRGHPLDLQSEQIAISVRDTWKSPQTGAVYPSEWTIEIPPEKIMLTVVPLLHEQELVTTGSTGIIYWEGAVKLQGHANGRPVHGKGYVELTGYALSMAGRL